MKMFLLKYIRLTAAALIVFSASIPIPARATESIVVYAAASSTNVVEEIIDLCGRKQAESIKTSLAASSVLAKQIHHGAPASVYLAANSAWMDYLQERGLLVAGSRHRLMGNSLVMIAPVSSPVPENLTPARVLAALPPDSRIAIGDPDHVPVGIYTKAALQHIDAWQYVQGRAARTANVRAALALVETGAAAAGIAYATDALISRKVRIVARFPNDSHPPIVYETAMIRGRDTPAVVRLYSCLRSADAARIFERYGFLALKSPRYANAE
jgi:molybdate transport system substrate-binding protein